MKTTSRFFVLVALATTVSTLGVTAHAQTVGASGDRAEKMAKAKEELHKRFGAADANVDGYLTKDEAQSKMPYVYKNFDAIDKAHAGKISMADIESYLMSQRGTRQRAK